MDYFVLDLETANADYASICQIGLVEVRNGTVVDQSALLIDPDDYFDPWNVSIHQITPAMVRGAPKFCDLYSDLTSRLHGHIVVHHGPFDRVAIQRASNRYQLDGFNVSWLDNQSVVRRTWTEFAQSGYALKKLTAHFGIDFKHHDALEDARATELIFRRAITESGTTAAGWLDRVKTNLSGGSAKQRHKRAGSEDGPFAGETIVFTGSLMIPRKQAADKAASLGFNVEDSVTKRTTVLCVGIQDRDKLAGYEKSSKHRKAESMIQDGFDISIISEADFGALISSSK